MRKILIGIDGGGSKTSLVAADEVLNILESRTGGASNFLSIGIEIALSNLSELIKPILKKYPNSNKILVLGTAGGGRREDAQKLEDALTKLLDADNLSVNVVSDAEITLKGAFVNNPGAILIAGTGSILYYKENDEIERVGGDGKIIGDEGSGYTIGRNALSHLSKVFDGRERATNLSRKMISQFGIRTQKELINNVYKNNFDIAGAAITVIETASLGDEISVNILEDAADKLTDHIGALIKRKNLEELKISFAGSLLTNENIYKEMVERKIIEKYSTIEIVEPKHKPEVGALLIAKTLISKES
ncbi:MAG: BadF/BadG/BcrA/BcrD ATPase family protein [Melioribacteraceae bacterium]|nr:BadF/BadG/BcrA/BcrD ATPase family protein [Melioribacteraceae bacterium]